MSTDWQDLEQIWSDNPRLHAWLAAQEAAFPAWARETGQEWDFTPGSLDRLEEWVRRRVSSYAEVKAVAEQPVVTVPAWYFGEVQNRHFGTMWQCRPEPSSDPLQRDAPFVIMPITEHQLARLEEYGELYEDEDYRPGCSPVDEIVALFLRGPDNHLRGQLDQYTRQRRQSSA